MNKNSIIAYLLIGFVIIGYFVLNQPDTEELKAKEQHRIEVAEMKKEKEAAQKEKNRKNQEEFNKLKSDSSSIYFGLYNGTEEKITLANDLVAIDLSTRGGRIESATLKEYKDQQGNDIVLFSDEDKTIMDQPSPNTLNYQFEINGMKDVNTKDCYFTKQSATDSTAVLRMEFGADRYIDFTYKLRNNSYMVDLYIQAHNMDDLLTSNENLAIKWDQLIRQQEPGHTFEQRYTSLTYKPVDDDSDYLSEIGSDSEDLSAQPISWIAYKNQFFSCILIAGDEFKNTNVLSYAIPEGSNMLKACKSTMTTTFDPMGIEPTGLQFYFGPNHFGTLQDCSEQAIDPGKDLELEEIIYFGWPIVRWINRYFIMYLFDALSGLGLNMGIVLILLTIIVKAIVFPFTKKSFISSAKMRALKPHIDEINAKYPKKEDALKKQQEVMGLYQKYGASPMGGCLPMLIQMPVFIALFNFVPNAIALRQQSFLWADDLSAFDAILSWETPLPLIGNHLSLFCLLFCVTQILNTYYTSKMQPNMGNPEMEQQQKMMRWMMYLMPVMFFFMFNNYSSGLNFYYFLSTLISVFTYIYLRKTTDESELLRKMEAFAESNKSTPAKKSNMMARLEALQEQQKKMLEEQEKLRNARKNRNR